MRLWIVVALVTACKSFLIRSTFSFRDTGRTMVNPIDYIDEKVRRSICTRLLFLVWHWQEKDSTRPGFRGDNWQSQILQFYERTN